MKRLLELMNTAYGSIVVSAIVGFGAAILFRRTCGDRCIVMKAPDLAALRKYIYEIDGTCYRYTPHAVACPGNHATQRDADENLNGGTSTSDPSGRNTLRSPSPGSNSISEQLAA
jgi:hypothetical protein